MVVGSRRKVLGGHNRGGFHRNSGRRRGGDGKECWGRRGEGDWVKYPQGRDEPDS